MIIDLPADAPRLTLRWNSPDGARDVVGHLVAANAEWYVVLPEDRPAVWVPRAEAQGVKEVPERTVLPGSPADAVERTLDRTLPGLRRARLGGWVLREGRWRTGRGNSVLAVGDPGLPFVDAVTAAADWYGRSPQLMVVVGGDVERQARDAGMRAVNEHLVMVADGIEGEALGGGRWFDEPIREWQALSARTDDDYLAELTTAPAHYLILDGVGVGRVAVWNGWALLSAIHVVPEHRGQGMGRVLTRALVDRAAGLGVRAMALQVSGENEVARRLYESEGFVEHHRYAYAVAL